MRPWRAYESCAGRLRRFVLRRALRHDAVRSTWNPLGVELALQHDFGFVLERVGHDAGVRRLDDVAGVDDACRLFCTLNL